VSFDVSAEAYARFMGRFSGPLAVTFAELAGPERGQCALDVGSGPGALTAVLVDRLGTESVAAVDPSPPFVGALAARFPGVDVHEAGAERLPFPDARFDLTLAQLVVPFMQDPVAGLREMARVTKPGGLVAACVWDHGPGGGGPLSTFWRAVRDLDAGAPDESHRPGATAPASTSGGSPTSSASAPPGASSAGWTRPAGSS
jgi:SAM-dependent methyltransferase